MTAFISSIDALFDDGNVGEDAIWRAAGAGDGMTVRVIRKSPDAVVGFADSRAILPAVMIDVRSCDIEAPAPRDSVEIAGTVFTITAEPIADSLRLVWSCEASERT
jgi:hypothetical protein